MTTEITTALEPVQPGDFHLVDEPMFAKVFITSVVIGPYQPRQTFIDETLQELAASIKKFGVNQPLLFRPAPGNPEMLELVAGERRFRAAIIAGREWVPGMVKALSDEDAATFRLVENMQREDVPPLEEAQGIKRLMDDYGFSVETIAEHTGKKKGVIYASLKLLNLSPAAQDMVKEKHVAASTALLVARIPVPALQEQAMSEIINNGGTAEPMSNRAAKKHIEDRYMLDLAEAEFSLEDKKLVKDCGACQDCPKRTINSPDDFPGVTADLCTDPDCFQGKVEAHYKVVVATALKRKIPVFACRADADKEFDPVDFVNRSTTRMYQFDRLANFSSDLLSQSDLPASAYPTPSAYYMLGDKPEPLFNKSAIQQALEDAGIARTAEEDEAHRLERQKEREKAEQVKKKEEAADPAAVQRKRIEEANEKIASAYNAFHDDLFEEIKDLVAPGILLPIYRSLAVYSAGMAARSNELAFSQRADESYGIDLEEPTAVADWLAMASDEDVCRLHLDAVLSDIPEVYASDIEGGLIKCSDEWDAWQIQHYETLIKIGSVCGIDVGLLRDKHLAKPLTDLADAMKPLEQKPAEKETAPPTKKQAKVAKPKAKVGPQAAASGDTSAPLPDAQAPEPEPATPAKKLPARPKAKHLSPEAAWPFPKSKDGA